MRCLLPAVAILLLAATALAQEPDQEPAQQPSVDDNSTQGPVPEPLPPPLARPPLGLEDVASSAVGRARLHLDRAEVLDSLGVRVLRRLEGGAPCDLLQAVRWQGSLLLGRVHDELLTAAALLEEPPGEERVGAAARDRLSALQARRDDLAGELARAHDRADPSGCHEGVQAPVWLPPHEREAVDGVSAVLFRTDAPGTVVWIDGAPRAVAGADGWAVALVTEGVRRVCAAPAEHEQCPAEVEVEAGMGDGFDLR